METIETLVEAGNKIRIISGEGIEGTIKPYSGARTLRGIKARLTHERCGGDRWARAEICTHTNEHGDVWVEIEA